MYHLDLSLLDCKLCLR